MIVFSGKTSNIGHVYTLIKPGIEGETPEQIYFGYLPDLAEIMLLSQGWCRPGSDREAHGYIPMTRDEVHAACEALLDPAIDCWGYKIVSGETMIARHYAYLADLDDVFSYYDGPQSDCEQAYAEREPVRGENGSVSYVVIDDPMELRICESVAQTKDRLAIHAMIDELSQLDEDFQPDIVKRLHLQLDESDLFL